MIYFGDMARLPYGNKSKEQILSFSIQNTLFLLKQKVKAVVIACNSSAGAAYSFLKRHFNLPIIDVIEPAARAAVRATLSGRIGVIATQATVESRAYEKALMKLNPKVRVFAGACPLFVPLVEEGWLNSEITSKVAELYLGPLKKDRIDALILGCTHYPLLKETIRSVVGSGIQLIDSVAPTVEELASRLDEKALSYPEEHTGRLKIFVSDRPRNFIRVGEQFLKEKLTHVEVVRQK